MSPKLQRFYLCLLGRKLCVVVLTAKQAEPYLYLHYYEITSPVHSLKDMAFRHGMEGKEEQFVREAEVVYDMPNSVKVLHATIHLRRGHASAHWVDYVTYRANDTKAVLIAKMPAPKPKVGKGTVLEWDAGFWHKKAPKDRQQKRVEWDEVFQGIPKDCARVVELNHEESLDYLLEGC